MTQSLSDYLKHSNQGQTDTLVVADEEQETEVATGLISGERTISGSTPIPEVDDDVLQSAQEVGLYTEADEENQQELNLAQEVDEAEIAFRDEQPQ